MDGLLQLFLSGVSIWDIFYIFVASHTKNRKKKIVTMSTPNNNPMQNIYNKMKRYYPVSEESFQRLSQHFTPHHFPRKCLFIQAGIIDRNVYFIEKGMTRSYCLVDGKEHTTWFSSEGDITFGLLCLYHNKAGFEYVETVEKTLAYSIPIQKLNELYETDIEIANWSRVIHQECLLALQCTRIDRLTLSARERYEKLLQLYPDICRRVNLGYIASYLGISISTLSRIRAEF